ncbi:Na+/H+ antiporter subunit E [Oceanobacillus bengalensis]|uniref:Na+/H+ antiporter subunit E n=1 Tax=Oceanobacillus bengalensis TaxID=1435466 RepID=A0A494Z6F0_9BACI|nr:Na+/H+ antiporter subunit E [Oceanobacillus bengalensis]RKQ17885.1 Na+/H+ antiporter subunit E [Oceanobacillus bengalensis]
MAFQIVINLIIAIMWMFLGESYTTPSFIAGYLFGILILYLLRRLIPGKFYFSRVISIIKLVLLFIKELVLSNIAMIKYIYSPKQIAEPGVFALPLDVKSDWEITLLTSLISLTPGTLSVALSDDNSKLFIHAMNIDDVNESIYDIKNSFEKAIMEVTR